MNKLIISILTLLLVTASGFAQTVTGTVTDNYGPVIGAAVMVQGTKIGASILIYEWKFHIEKCS